MKVSAKHSKSEKRSVDEINYEDFALFMEDCVKSNRKDRATSRVLFELIGGGTNTRPQHGVVLVQLILP